MENLHYLGTMDAVKTTVGVTELVRAYNRHGNFEEPEDLAEAAPRESVGRSRLRELVSRLVALVAPSRQGVFRRRPA